MKWSRLAKTAERIPITLGFVLVIAYQSNDFWFCSGWLEALIPLSVIRGIMICDAIVMNAILIAYFFAWALYRRKGTK